MGLLVVASAVRSIPDCCYSKAELVLFPPGCADPEKMLLMLMASSGHQHIHVERSLRTTDTADELVAVSAWVGTCGGPVLNFCALTYVPRQGSPLLDSYQPSPFVATAFSQPELSNMDASCMAQSSVSGS